jgi:hypothetical protein
MWTLIKAPDAPSHEARVCCSGGRKFPSFGAYHVEDRLDIWAFRMDRTRSSERVGGASIEPGQSIRYALAAVVWEMIDCFPYRSSEGVLHGAQQTR